MSGSTHIRGRKATPSFACTIGRIVSTGGGQAAFTIDAFARECLMAGVDEIGYVLAQDEAIARFESSRSSSRW